MKKKIAIITTHRANNFGAMLQAYSLVKACQELGGDAEILDWRSPFFEWLYHKAWRMRINPIPALKRFMSFVRDEKKSRIMFDDFRSRLPMSRKITRRIDLENIESEYDIFIAGSDQIWNPMNSAIKPMACDRAYLLDFVESKTKCAYAASIGKQSVSPLELLQEFIKLWKSFAVITMREHLGADYVGNCIGRKVETVVDPVLLHDSVFWRKVASPISNARGYVLLYNIKRSYALKELAHRVARERGLEVVDLFIPGQVRARNSKTTSAGPEEFLSYIDGADSVFTGSFHASAFSVIFGKKLYVQCPKNVDNTNSRIETLLSWGQLPAVVQTETDKERILYCDCQQKDVVALEKEIKRSRAILSKMIE